MGEGYDRSSSSPDLGSEQIYDLSAPGSQSKRFVVRVCMEQGRARRNQGADTHSGMPGGAGYYFEYG